MKILLDFDGVLITTPAWKTVDTDVDGFLKFNETASANLKKLVKETGATIVLTSTHRINYTTDKWLTLFNGRGIPTSKIEKIDNSKSLNEMTGRANEIVAWADQYGQNENFVVLDDDQSLNSLPDWIKKKIVLTQPLIGFDTKTLETAFAILKNN